MLLSTHHRKTINVTVLLACLSKGSIDSGVSGSEVKIAGVNDVKIISAQYLVNH